VVIGAMLLGTLAISRFSLKFGIPAVMGVLLFHAGLCSELDSIRAFSALK